jgi:arsenite/tail-anchored protein-transporting ATPase
MSLAAASGNANLIMIGGKGGVGKTTCASAIALGFAQQGRKVLIISSDPTPSLSDIFETEIGGREVALSDNGRLWGLEISSEMVLQKWRDRFGSEIYDVISSFASVDYDFVDYIGTAPGIEEEYMLYFILDLVKSGKYETVVWDTAPAGHTLRLLRLPHLFLDHLEAATKFYMNMYRFIERFKDTVKLRSSKKSLLEIIGSWQELSQGIIDFIQDGEAARYVLVTIPEALGVRLTERMVRELEGHGLMVGDVIINHVVKEADCEFHRKRRAMQDHYIELIEEAYRSLNISKLYLSPYEIKGIERIREVAAALLA